MAPGRKMQAVAAADGRKREILVATLRLIAAGGVDAITHRRVAEEASVPLGSLTYYFESREDLIREAFRLYIAEATAVLVEMQWEMPPATPEELVALIMEILRREFAEPAMLRTEYEMILHAARDEQVAREFAAWERSLEAGLAGPLEAMGATHPLRDARTILHVIRGAELQQIANRGEHALGLKERLLSIVNAFIARDKIADAAVARGIPAPSRATPKSARRRGI